MLWVYQGDIEYIRARCVEVKQKVSLKSVDVAATSLPKVTIKYQGDMVEKKTT